MANGTMLLTVLTTVVIDCFTPSISFEDTFMTDINLVYRARFWAFQRKAAKAARRRKLGARRLQAAKARVNKASRRTSRSKLVAKSAAARVAHRAWVAARVQRRANRLQPVVKATVAKPVRKQAVVKAAPTVVYVSAAIKRPVPKPVRRVVEAVQTVLATPVFSLFNRGQMVYNNTPDPEGWVDEICTLQPRKRKAAVEPTAPVPAPIEQVYVPQETALAAALDYYSEYYPAKTQAWLLQKGPGYVLAALAIVHEPCSDGESVVHHLYGVESLRPDGVEVAIPLVKQGLEAILAVPPKDWLLPTLASTVAAAETCPDTFALIMRHIAGWSWLEAYTAGTLGGRFAEAGSDAVEECSAVITDILGQEDIHTIQDLNSWVLYGSTTEPQAAAPAVPNLAQASDQPLTEGHQVVAQTTQMDLIEDKPMATASNVVEQQEAGTSDDWYEPIAGGVGFDIPAPTEFTPAIEADLLARFEASERLQAVSPVLQAAVQNTLNGRPHDRYVQFGTNAMLNMVLTLRLAGSQVSGNKGILLPECIQVGGTVGLVPRYFWTRMPGGEQINRLVNRDAQGRLWAERKGESGALALGFAEHDLEERLGKWGWDDYAQQSVYEYTFKDSFTGHITRTITYQPRAAGNDGAPRQSVGLPKRTAQKVAAGVLHAFRLKDVKGLRVYIPQDIFDALRLFFEYGRTQGNDPRPYQVSCKYVAVANNWLQPVSNLSFTDVRDAFRYLQIRQLQELPVLVGHQAYAPFTYVDVADGFQLHLAGGSMFHVVQGVNGTASVPYFKPANTASWLRIKPALVGTMNGDNEYQRNEVSKLSALDMFWYLWESFGLMAMNRDYFRKSRTNNLGDLLKQGAQGSVELKRFVQKYIPVDLEEQVQGEFVTHRDLFNSERYSVCELAQPMPIEVVWAPNGQLTGYVPGEESANRWSNQSGKRGITEYIKWAKAGANMMATERSKAINMVDVANRFYDLAILPIANCDVFVGHKIGVTRFNHLEYPVAKAMILDMFRANWKAWGFFSRTAEFGDLKGLKPKEVERRIALAIWSNVHNKRTLTKFGLTKDDWTNDRYWQTMQQWGAVTHSNKGSKALKRAVSNFACICELDDEEVTGWVFADAVGKQKSYAQLVRTALLFNLPTHDPGMGLVRASAMKALYNSKRELAVVPMFQRDECYFQLDERFAGQVRPIVTAAQGQVGWAFDDGIQVERDEVLGSIMFNGRELELIRTREAGHLKSVTWAYSLESTSSQYFTLCGTVRPQVCNSLKLRHGIKLNALGANLNYSLGYGPMNSGRKGQRLNGEDFGSNIDMLVPQDCDKGKDNFAFKLRIMGANYAYHAQANPDMRALLVSTNNAVQRALGAVVVDEVADHLLVDAGCCAAGHYAALNQDFEARFARAIWVYQQTPEPALAEVIASQTLNKALCTDELNAAGKPIDDFDPWRFVGSAEAALLTGVGDDNTVGLPAELLHAVRKAEATGTYAAVTGAVSRAYIVTNAQGAIEDQDTVVCHWVAEFNGRQHHQLLMRGYGWGRKDGLDFVYPAEVEYTTIPQSVTDTNLMAFAMLDNRLRGHAELALEQTKQSIINLELDRMLASWISGAKPVSLAGHLVPTVDLTNTSGTLDCGALGLDAPGLWADLNNDWVIKCPEHLFTTEALEVLRSPEVNRDRYLFAQWLAHYCGAVVFRLPAGDNGRVCSVHLGTLFAWGGSGLHHSGQTATSALIDFFKLWLAGSNPHSAECYRATGSYVRMVRAYLQGEGHTKGLLRGTDTVQMKAAASCLVPNDEVWVCAKNARHFARVFGCAVADITHVGFRRMPMFRTNVSKIKFLSNADVSELNRLYGITFSAGRVYMGTAQMYSNFGDLDGDAIELDNLTGAVARGLITVDGFESIKAVLNEVLGIDTFDYRYWLAGVADQYIADHFNFGTYKTYLKKSAITYRLDGGAGNVTTLDQFAEFQKAATTVQTTTVGKTYSAATLNGMLAELVPVVAETVNALGEGDWLPAYSWAQEPESARKVVYKLLQLYEIALGGYDPDMEAVTLGYLVRAMNGDQDTCHWSNLVSVVERIDHGVVSNIGSLLPQAPRLVEWNHVPDEVVRKSLVKLGFADADFTTFRDTFLMAGLSIALPYLGDDLGAVPVSLQMILSIVQGTLDITQNKLKGAWGESPSLELFHTMNTQIVAGKAVGQDGYMDADTQQWLLHLRDQILDTTVTGSLFKNYYLSWLDKHKDVVTVGGLHIVDAPIVAQAEAQ